MIIIRHNTFETNSSSTHAIGIPRKSNYKKQKHIDFYWGEFGWEYNVYYDTLSKASYLYTMIKYFNGDYIKEHNKACEYISKIRQYLDEEDITYCFEESHCSDYFDNGYIDHGSYSAEIVEGILKSKESFLTYLFDDKAYVSTGNDNEDGYYIPEIGRENDFYDFDEDGDYDKEWNEKITQIELEYDMYYKGN